MTKKVVIKKQTILKEEPEQKSKGFFSYLRFGESYTSLILGIIVVIITTALLLSVVHKKNAGNINTPVSQDTKTSIEITQKMLDLQKTAPRLIVDNVLPTDTPAQVVTPTNEPTPTSKPKPTPIQSGPTNVPKPTQKPMPTHAAVPTSKPKPTATPKVIAMAKKPEVTKTPRKVKPTSKPQVKMSKNNSTWTVQKGESLWSIAERNYHNGNNWTDIARANKLSNPRDIHAGDKLQLPSVKLNDQNIATVTTNDEQSNHTVQKNTTQPKPAVHPTVQPNAPNNTMAKITGNSYDVVHGDNLWNIAVRAYGDGYRWVDIARANGLTNPRVIHAGNHFVIPR